MNAATHCLVRFGAIPEVARCRVASDTVPGRGVEVVIESHRGRQLGAVVDVLPVLRAAPEASDDEHAGGFIVLRRASPDDQSRQRELRREAEQDFSTWVDRIRQWKIDVQLIDLEWTLDHSKLVLYVLNERGPECTKLAIQAAAAGLGIVEVQPVSRDGLVSQPSNGGGCGSCGCHN